MKTFLHALLLAALLLPSAKGAPQSDLSELTNQEFLFKIIRYLYRWHLDENHAQVIVEDGFATFLIHEEPPSSDEDDNSRFALIVLPQVNYTLTLKKADYEIPELNLVAHSDTFEIVHVSTGITDEALDDFQEVNLGFQEIQDYAYRTRNDVQFPEGDLLKAMREEARREILEYLETRQAEGLPVDYRGFETLEEFLTADQEIHLAPLPEVANDVWIFWETGGILLHFSSELELNDPKLWENDFLTLDLYDIDEQTVVSLHEVAGSNAYLTRDQVGRILYNCIVLGKRVVLEPGKGLPQEES